MKKIVIAILVAAFSATIAFAQGPAERLNLSDAQKAQWKQLRRSFHEENKAFLQSARQTMHDFRAARQAHDTATIESLKPTVQANRAQMRQLREAQEQKLMAILNDEQRAQFLQFKSERQQHRRR
jgi:Spy/CpxP family protein refolding chaperone